MNNCLIVGRPNAGKTCFVINFATYMGAGEIKIYRKRKAGFTAARTFSPGEAHNNLVSQNENTTRKIQGITIKVPAGKTYNKLMLIDTCGLKNSSSSKNLRLQMADTIRELQQHQLIIHIIDLKNIPWRRKNLLPAVDKMIMNFSREDKIYFLLANKIDLPGGQKKYQKLKKYLDVKYLFPVSALYQKGFDDVRNHLLSFL